MSRYRAHRKVVNPNDPYERVASALNAHPLCQDHRMTPDRLRDLARSEGVHFLTPPDGAYTNNPGRNYRALAERALPITEQFGTDFYSRAFAVFSEALSDARVNVRKESSRAVRDAKRAGLVR